MDPEQERDQRDEKRSSVDRANEYANKARKTYKRSRKAMATASWGKKLAAQGIRSGATAIAGATSEVWVPAVVVIIIIIVFLMILLGGSTDQLDDLFGKEPICGGISATPAELSASASATLNVTGCPPEVFYQWGPPEIGILSGTSTPTTTYTAPSVITTKTQVQITVTVCNPAAQAACTNLTTSITLVPAPTGTSPYTCQNVVGQYCNPTQCSVDGDKTGTGDCPGTQKCCQTSVSCANIDARLKSDFGIVVRGDPAGISFCDAKKTVYNIMLTPFKSPTFAALFKNGPDITVRFIDDGECLGHALRDSRTILLHSFFTACRQPSTRKYILIHEAGHATKWSNGRTFQNFGKYYLDDSSCYRSGYLRSYPFVGGGGGGYSESHAEAIANYILFRSPLRNFYTQCPRLFNWLQEDVYGNVRY